jgi:hypothetical protein
MASHAKRTEISTALLQKLKNLPFLAYFTVQFSLPTAVTHAFFPGLLLHSSEYFLVIQNTS